MEHRTISGWPGDTGTCCTHHLALIGWMITALTVGFPTATRLQWTLTDNMLVNSFGDLRPDTTLYHTWENSCCNKPREDMSPTLISYIDLIYSGTISTLELHYVPLGRQLFHHVNTSYGLGLDYIILPGSSTFGRMVDQSPDTLGLDHSFLTYMPWTEQGPPRLVPRPVPKKACPGTLHRSRPIRTSLPRRGGRRKRGTCMRSAHVVSRHRWLGTLNMEIWTRCPLQWLLHWSSLLDSLAHVLPWSLIQFAAHARAHRHSQVDCSQHSLNSSHTRQANMPTTGTRASDSEEIDTRTGNTDMVPAPTTPGGTPLPRGPPPPNPVHRGTGEDTHMEPAEDIETPAATISVNIPANTPHNPTHIPANTPVHNPGQDLQPMAHRVAGAVAQAFLEQGTLSSRTYCDSGGT